MTKISFIVLTYNRTDALLPVLRSLATQCNADSEVLIADDGSNESQVHQLVEQCPRFSCRVRHVWHPDTGFTAAAARNLGATHASGDYLVFLDGDCVPNRTFVHAHARLAERGFYVNGSRVLLGPEITQRVIDHRIDLLAKGPAFWLGARLAGDSNKLLHVMPWPRSLFRVKHGFSWKGIRSCNFGVWKHDFTAVNGFDESFEGWGHEDADLVLRLSHLGLKRKNGFLATEVYHLWHRELSRQTESVNRQRVLGRMISRQLLAEKGLNQTCSADSVRVSDLW